MLKGTRSQKTDETGARRSSWVLRARWQLYLQMLETTGLGHIGGMTKKGSAALVFMSWSDDTT